LTTKTETPPEVDAGLASVIDAWPRLDQHVQAAIVELATSPFTATALSSPYDSVRAAQAVEAVAKALQSPINSQAASETGGRGK
jgi:hypothetical protein